MFTHSQLTSPSTSQMYSTPSPSFHPPVRQESMYLVIVTKRRHLILVWYWTCESGAMWWLSESSCWALMKRDCESVERSELPICPCVTAERRHCHVYTGDDWYFSPSLSGRKQPGLFISLSHPPILFSPSLLLPLSPRASSSSSSLMPKELILFAMRNTIINDNKIFL